MDHGLLFSRLFFGAMLLFTLWGTFKVSIVTPEGPPELFGSTRAIQIRVRSYTDILCVVIVAIFLFLFGFWL